MRLKKKILFKICLMIEMFCCFLQIGVYADGEYFEDFMALETRIMRALERFISDTRCVELKRYLLSEKYTRSGEEEDLAIVAEPLYMQYALRVCDYVDKNIVKNLEDRVSVSIYAAMTDKTPDEICKMFRSR